MANKLREKDRKDMTPLRNLCKQFHSQQVSGNSIQLIGGGIEENER